MTHDIFTDDEDRKLARESIPDLMLHNAWKLIVRALDANIEYLSEQLHARIKSKRDFDSLEQIYALQDRIDDLKKMKELPKTLLQSAQPEIEEEEETIYE